MKRRTLNIVIIIILLASVFSSCTDSEKSINVNEVTTNKYTEVNKLIKAEWANTGSWIMIYDPNINGDLKECMIGQISLDKDMFNGSEKQYIVDEFRNKVNDKFNKGVKVVSYKRDKQVFELKYEDGTSVIWDYILRKCK